MKTHSLLSAHALTLGLAALLLPAAHAAEPTAAPAFRLDGRPADSPFGWSELTRFAAPAAPSGAVTPTPQAALGEAYVDTHPNLSGGYYLGPTYTVPPGGAAYEQLYDGYNQVGMVTHSSGTLTLPSYLSLGDQSGSNGTYNLSGTGTINTTETDVGYHGTGVFNQSGGTHNVGSNGLKIGYDSGSNGTYNLNGGTLSAGGTEYIGQSGKGTFTQATGTTHTVNDDLYLGFGAGGNGTYNLSGGTLSVGGGEAVGDQGKGTFTQSGGSHTVSGTLYLGFDAGGNGTYNLSGGTLTTALTQVSDDNNTSVFTQNGGTHTTTALGLTGYSTSSVGTYNLNGGTLVTGSVSAGDPTDPDHLTGTSTFNFNGGTLQASASTATFFGGLSTANVQVGGAIFDTQGFNVTATQALLTGTATGTADGGLTKRGTGTLTLTGNNTYTGPTAVNAGTLLVNGTHSGTGAVTVANGGALGGNGALAGAVTVQSGGRLDAGNAGAAGMLSLASSLSLNAGATLGVELGGTTPGTGYDQIRVAGTLTLGGTLSVTEISSFKLSLGQTFVILDDTGTSLVTTTFANAPLGLYTDAAGNTFLVNYAADADADLLPNDVTLTVQSVVPEPSTWALLTLGTAALGLALRRQRRSAAAAAVRA